MWMPRGSEVGMAVSAQQIRGGPAKVSRPHLDEGFRIPVSANSIILSTLKNARWRQTASKRGRAPAARKEDKEEEEIGRQGG